MIISTKEYYLHSTLKVNVLLFCFKILIRLANWRTAWTKQSPFVSTTQTHTDLPLFVVAIYSTIPALFPRRTTSDREHRSMTEAKKKVGDLQKKLEGEEERAAQLEDKLNSTTKELAHCRDRARRLQQTLTDYSRAAKHAGQHPGVTAHPDVNLLKRLHVLEARNEALREAVASHAERNARIDTTKAKTRSKKSLNQKAQTDRDDDSAASAARATWEASKRAQKRIQTLTARCRKY